MKCTGCGEPAGFLMSLCPGCISQSQQASLASINQLESSFAPVEPTKRCPHCRKEILTAAIKCEHCTAVALTGRAQTRAAEVAAAIAGVGVFLPWVSASGPGGVLQKSGMVVSGGWLCLAMLFLGALCRGERRSLVAGWLYLGAAPIAGYKVLLAHALSPISQAYYTVTIGPGVGVYMTLFGSAVAGILAFREGSSTHLDSPKTLISSAMTPARGPDHGIPLGALRAETQRPGRCVTCRRTFEAELLSEHRGKWYCRSCAPGMIPGWKP